MQVVLKFVLIFLAFIIQGTWVQYIGILGVTPNAVLALIIALALVSEPFEAGAYGFAAGALWDLMWGRVFGIHTLLFLYVALLARAFIELMYKKGLSVVIVITFLAAIFYETVFFFLSFFIWGETGFLYVMLRIIIPSAAYTGVAQILIYSVTDALPLTRHERGGGYEI